MAPAASDTLERFMAHHSPSEYDMIITGDLGREGRAILVDLLKSKNIDISANHVDCGMMIYNSDKSDTHAGACLLYTSGQPRAL